MREREFIDWIRTRRGLDPAAVPVGPGDDTAVVACGGERLLLTTDQVLDGVHFRLAEHGPRPAGWKAMARCLSDVAAMAAEPVAAVAAVALPAGFSRGDAEQLYHGLRAAGEAVGCPLVGGDLAGWDGPLTMTVTAAARPGGIEPVLRSGARPGDALCVTGWLGGAWRTRRHLEFLPRIAEARALAAAVTLHAMIDISDGLSTDLGRLCEASGVGAEIAASTVPVHPDAAAAEDSLAAALGDGEDYELLFALAAGDLPRLPDPERLGVPITRIGTVTAGGGLVLLDDDGRRRPLSPTGWEHRT